ncbi:MAG: aspartate ammonia-lyase, partial [Thermodesulfovibrionales bacterium]
RSLNELVIKDLTINEDAINQKALQNPILGTALVPITGYDKARDVIETAMALKKSVIDVVVEKGYISEQEAKELLDLKKMIKPLE